MPSAPLITALSSKSREPYSCSAVRIICCQSMSPVSCSQSSARMRLHPPLLFNCVSSPAPGAPLSTWLFRLVILSLSHFLCSVSLSLAHLAPRGDWGCLSVSASLLSRSGANPSKGPPQTTPLEPSIGLSLPGKFGEGTFALLLLSRAWLYIHRRATPTHCVSNGVETHDLTRSLPYQRITHISRFWGTVSIVAQSAPFL